MNSATDLIKRRRRLRDHIDLIMAKPCQWGVDDCTAWAASWVEKETGIPIPLPGYSCKDEAHSLIMNAGGLESLWDETMSRAGVHQTDYPQYGDVGVMDTRRFGPVGFIMADFGVALWRSETGYLGIRPSSILKAWAV